MIQNNKKFGLNICNGIESGKEEEAWFFVLTLKNSWPTQN
jgi:hypothetical protein